jgi:ABC-type branched-subunit amino acid transport system ATPase component
VNPTLVAGEVTLLRALRDEGRAIFLIEHNMELVADACDTVVVLHAGQVIARGTPAEIRRDATVVRTYLGERA